MPLIQLRVSHNNQLAIRPYHDSIPAQPPAHTNMQPQDILRGIRSGIGPKVGNCLDIQAQRVLHELLDIQFQPLVLAQGSLSGKRQCLEGRQQQRFVKTANELAIGDSQGCLGAECLDVLGHSLFSNARNVPDFIVHGTTLLPMCKCSLCLDDRSSLGLGGFQ